MRYIDADEIMRRLTYNGDTPVHETYRDGTPVLLQIRGIKNLIRNAPTVQLPALTPDPVTGRCRVDAAGSLNTIQPNTAMWRVSRCMQSVLIAMRKQLNTMPLCTLMTPVNICSAGSWTPGTRCGDIRKE